MVGCSLLLPFLSLFRIPDKVYVFLFHWQDRPDYVLETERKEEKGEEENRKREGGGDGRKGG